LRHAAGLRDTRLRARQDIGMNTALWSWRALGTALGLAGSDGPDIADIGIDSRRLRPGSLFVALPGEQPGGRDGHDFVAAAAAAGAAGALVARPVATPLPCLQVADTLAGLRAIAVTARVRSDARRVAITGSSGKTTLKAMLAAALDVHASEGSFNNHIGVPLTLSRMPASSRLGIFEIGTNHPGEIAPLSALVAPHVAVVLNVLGAHIGNFDGIEALRREKLSIADGLVDGGTLVLHESLAGTVPGRHCVYFGSSPSAAARLLDYRAGVARLRVAGGEHTLPVPGGGSHRALTLLAALTVVDVLGGDVAAAAARIVAQGPPAGRGDRHEVGGITVIDDSYNANPASMAASLATLREMPARRRLAILGDMLELGDAEASLHRGVAVACDGIDRVLCVGGRMRLLADALPAGRCWGLRDSAAAIDVPALAAELAAGDVLLVKGSSRIFWADGFVARLLAALRAREAGR
jgi:UDP-N-acetylmuramoyl-tripeptide--D-alanyl-D-alanine ligase